MYDSEKAFCKEFEVANGKKRGGSSILLNNFIKNGVKFSNEFFKKFCVYMYDIYDFFLKTEKIDSTDICFMFDKAFGYSISTYCEAIYKKIIKSGFRFTEKDLQFFLEKVASLHGISAYDKTNKLFVVIGSLIVTNMDSNIIELKKLLLKYPLKTIRIFLHTDNDAITITTDEGNTIYQIIMNEYHIDNIKVYIDWLFKHKFTPNDVTIKLALACLDYDMLVSIFSNFKLICTEEHFRIIIRSRYAGVDLIAQIIDLLVDNGLNMNVELIIEALKNRFYVNCIDRFIKIDKDKELLKEACLTNNFFKYPLIINVDKDTAALYELCNSGYAAFPAVKKLIAKTGVKPDLTALKVACDNKYQKKVVEFFLLTVKPDKECFVRMCRTFDSSKGLIFRLAKELYIDPKKDI